MSSSIAHQDLLECATEVQVKDGVDDGIEGRIDVSKPSDQVLQPSNHDQKTLIACATLFSLLSQGSLRVSLTGGSPALKRAG